MFRPPAGAGETRSRLTEGARAYFRFSRKKRKKTMAARLTPLSSSSPRDAAMISMTLNRTISASSSPSTSRCPASRPRRRGVKGARSLRSSSIVASSISSPPSAPSSPPPSPPPLDPSIDARARHNAEQAATFDSAVEAFLETPPEVVPVSEKGKESHLRSSFSLFFFSRSLSHPLSPPPQLPTNPNSASSASPRRPARRSPRPSRNARTRSPTPRECWTSGPGRAA